MDAHESERLFKMADELYRAERYADALEVLDRLDIAFPNTKNILMPRAMCLVHLGQLEPGRAIYEHLAAQYPPERLTKLRKLLEKASRPVPPPPPIDALDAVLNVNARGGLDDARITATPQAVKDARMAASEERASPRATEGPNWGKWVAIGGAVVVLLAFLSLPLFIESDGSAPSREGRQLTQITGENIEDLPEAELMRFMMVMIFVIFPLALLSIPLPIFLTLYFFSELPKESVLLSYLILLGYMFVIYFVCGLVFGCLGMFLPAGAGFGYLIAVLLIVNQIFELGWPRTLIFAGFTIVSHLIQWPLFSVILRMFSFEVPMW